MPSKKRKRLVICISGMAGCGKSTLARKIAKRLNLRHFSGGDALKALALDTGYKQVAKGWWESPEGMKFLKKRAEDPSFDKKVDEKLKRLAKEGNVVLDSWTMPWLLKDDGFKVWLEASVEERARRIAKRDRTNLEEALEALRKRDAKTKAIYKKLYRFNLGEDLSPFDLVLDVDNLNSKEVFRVLSLLIEHLYVKSVRGKEKDQAKM